MIPGITNITTSYSRTPQDYPPTPPIRPLPHPSAPSPSVPDPVRPRPRPSGLPRRPFPRSVRRLVPPLPGVRPARRNRDPWSAIGGPRGPRLVPATPSPRNLRSADPAETWRTIDHRGAGLVGRRHPGRLGSRTRPRRAEDCSRMSPPTHRTTLGTRPNNPRHATTNREEPRTEENPQPRGTVNRGNRQPRGTSSRGWRGVSRGRRGAAGAVRGAAGSAGSLRPADRRSAHHRRTRRAPRPPTSAGWFRTARC